MSGEALLQLLKELPEYTNVLKGIKGQIGQQLVYGISGSPRNYFYAGLIKATNKNTLIVTHSPQHVKQIVEELKNYIPEERIYNYPPPEILTYDVEAHSNAQAGQRIEILSALVTGKELVVVTTGESLLKKIVPIQTFRDATLHLAVGEIIEINQLLKNLVLLGYQRVDLIEGKGQFSLRGGIIDIYPLNGQPARVELFDDEIDSIRLVDIESQKSIEKLDKITIAPGHEVFIIEEKDQIKEAIEKDYQQQIKKLKRQKRGEAVTALEERIGALYEELDNGIYENLERWLSYIYPQAVTLLDYFQEEGLVFIDEPTRTFDQIKLIEKEIAETYLALTEKGLALPGQMRAYINHEDLLLALSNTTGVAFSLLPKQPAKLVPKALINIQSKPVPIFNSKLEQLVDEIKNLRQQDYRIILANNSPERAEKTREFLQEEGYSVTKLTGDMRLEPGQIAIVDNMVMESGFDFPENKLAVLTDWEIYGKKKVVRKAKKKKRESNLEVFTDLKIGDFVVHINHGIGKYLGVERLEISGVHKDYLIVKYAGEDKLYIPTDQVGVLQKYLGAEGHNPKLYKLGGNEWTKVKTKVQKSIQDMAHELLALYATREKLPGYAFAEDTVWQKEFEDAFPYEETADQVTAIEDVKKDMERTKPMDRLVCGDVGYGKTEVAIRAAFKAVMDGKQVALLVPTTILAQQHYNNFKERFAEYAISVEMLSRFRSPKEQKKTMENLALGLVDIVIGTHRLVSDDIKFNNIGLLIIDEEQRFGVTHKEKIKHLKKNIDVLTLTATPIPRTLHMSLVGVRDMSVLETPPEERFPVLTYVVEYNLAVIRDVIRREINRGGQVYFVHNRISDMEKTLAELETMIPEARIVIAHGRMREDQLENIMLAFMEGEYDVLLCTTIVETGLDIPNVNTIIVDEADKMGLSQLYQLRGRVGRSNRQAYAYFTYKKDKVLTEVAEKRLHAIREFTEFGSGFKIAMRDLEIRGAGNILGPEQHGDLVSVGFDMYCRLLEEAIQEIKGEKVVETPDPIIDLKVDAFIDDSYINDTATKFEFYKKIMICHSINDVMEVEDEMVDRFGDLPEAVTNLMEISKIKVLSKGISVTTINQAKDMIKIKFSEAFQPTGQALLEVSKNFRSGMINFSATPNLEIKLQIKGLNQKQILILVSKVLDSLIKATKEDGNS